MKKETKVNCEVENCKHNDSKKCDLEELVISCTCDKENCENKKETICNNFEKNDDNNKECGNEEYELENASEQDEIEHPNDEEIDGLIDMIEE